MQKNIKKSLFLIQNFKKKYLFIAFFWVLFITLSAYAINTRDTWYRVADDNLPDTVIWVWWVCRIVKNNCTTNWDIFVPTKTHAERDNAWWFISNHPGCVTILDCSMTDENIGVWDYPHRVTYNPNTKNIYIANGWDDTVTVISTLDNSIVTTINVWDLPSWLYYNSNTNKIYVSNTLDNSISVINPSTNTVESTINWVNWARQIVYNPLNNHLYVSNWDWNTISIIDTTTNSVIGSIDVGYRSRGLSFDPIHNYIGSSLVKRRNST